jgi:Zn-finger nucleic acid-binding protein
MGKINCPVCQTQMIRMVDKNQLHIWFESCTKCYGIFFDAGEFKDYKEETLADFFKDLMAKPRDF